MQKGVNREYLEAVYIIAGAWQGLGRGLAGAWQGLGRGLAGGKKQLEDGEID